MPTFNFALCGGMGRPTVLLFDVQIIEELFEPVRLAVFPSGASC